MSQSGLASDQEIVEFSVTNLAPGFCVRALLYPSAIYEDYFMRFSILFFIFCFAAIISRADIVALEKSISVRDGIKPWNAELVDQVLSNPELKKRGLMECAELTELVGAYFCASTKKSYMNKALVRASMFSEGTQGLEKGTVIGTNSSTYTEMVPLVLGHDIPSEALLGFWTALTQACERGETCATPEEKEFFEGVVLPISQKSSRFVVITYSLEGEWYQTVTHELMHAQYFLDSKFREITDKFWDENVSSADREKIKQVLGQGYNQNDEFLMRNEFQAYLLDSQANFSWLKDFAPRYRNALIQKLVEAGVPPLEVH